MRGRRKQLIVLGAATFTPRGLFACSKQPIPIGVLRTEPALAGAVDAHR